MYQLFETICIEDGEVKHLSYHQERLSKESKLSLAEVIEPLTIPKEGVHKLRISYNTQSVKEVTITPYTPKIINSLRVVECDYIDYYKKYEDRAVINQLYQQRGDADDIIIVKKGLVTDTSFCNILLFDGDKWVTPTSYLLEGTCRRRLLRDGVIDEREVKIDDLANYQYLMPINAMLDFNTNRKIEIANNNILLLT